MSSHQQRRNIILRVHLENMDEQMMQGGDWIRKIRLISKFMASRPGYQTITILILPNISRSKGNQKMKFGQLRM